MLRPFHIAVIALATALPAFAQVADNNVPPNSDTAMATPRPQPSPPQETVATPSAEEENVKLQFPNSDVADVLRFYEELTGKKLVMDNNVTGKVNIFISKPITRDEAIKIIEMNLLLNGYALVNAENDIVKVIGSGKNPRSAGVPIISDEADIPEGDHVISYLFKLNYADPQELQQVIGQYLSPAQSYTSFLALPKSSSLLVTESSDVIRKLAKIVNQVDVPPAEVVSKFVKLERADASKVVDMLHDIFEKDAQNTPAGIRRGVRPVVPTQPQPIEAGEMGALLGLSEESVIVGKIKLTADVRTNRIHVITRPANLPFIERLIAEFDANVEFAKPVTRPLRYISAADVLPVLVQALAEPGEEQQAGAGGQNTPSQQQQQQRQSNSNPASSTSNTGGEGTLNISEELSTQPVDTTPKAVTIGNAKIIADQRSNSIIVLGNREVVVKVQKILDEMDVKSPQVALSTVIGELTLSNDEEFGVDYFAKYKNKVVGISRNTSAPLPFPTPDTSGSPSGTVSPGILDPSGLINFSQILQSVGSGTNVYIAAGNYLSAIVHALDSTGRFKVISRPMVFTSNNKKAIIASGSEIPVPVSTLSSNQNVVGGIAQQSNIQYKKVALQLEVVPLINSEKEVSLDILQKIDSLAGSTRVDGNDIPNIATRYIRTSVSAPNGATIVLGGLIMDSKQDNRSGIPVLSRLPLVGALFRNTGRTKDRTELIILMRPEVSLTGLDQYRLRRKTEDKTHFGPEIDQDDCPDCPPKIEGKETTMSGKDLPPPDLPPVNPNR